MKTISIAPPHSLFLIMDYSFGKPPEQLGNNRIGITDSCIAIGCRMAQDGPTEVHLARKGEAEPNDPLVFDGKIATPSKLVSVVSTMNESLLAIDVSGNETRIRVFANHATEPNRILVEIS